MKGSETAVKLLSLKAHTQYNNGLQRPAKPNVGGLLLLTGVLLSCSHHHLILLGLYLLMAEIITY